MVDAVAKNSNRCLDPGRNPDRRDPGATGVSTDRYEGGALRELGMTYPEIGMKLGVDRWTVGKAVRWMLRQRDVRRT